MESTNGFSPTKFDPKLDIPVDVTARFEEKNTYHAVRAIEKALDDYLSVFSNIENPSVSFCADGYYWICIGDVSLSQALRNNILKKFTVSDGQPLRFSNWDKMKSNYPQVETLRHLNGKSPSFVGLPLPKEMD